MASSSKPENWLLFLVYSHRCPSSKINGWPKNWLIASVSYGIHWPRTQERLSMTPSSVGQAFVQNSMTTLGSYFAIGSFSCVQRLLETLAWNSAYFPSASWTRLSLRKDQSSVTSKRHWCSSLRNRCPSNSMYRWSRTWSFSYSGFPSSFSRKFLRGHLWQPKKQRKNDTSILAKFILKNELAIDFFFYIYICIYTFSYI